jgi:hypothetical protein
MNKPNNWQKILALFGGDMDKVVTTREILTTIGDGKTHSWYITPNSEGFWCGASLGEDPKWIGHKRGLGYGYIKRVGRGKYKITEKGLNYKK